MTNQTIDFDQSDAEVLAEFAGLERHEELDSFWVHPDNPETPIESDASWMPWSLEAPMWQRQVLLDAVREKGLEREFMLELHGSHPMYSENPNEKVFEATASPPEAICQSILEMEGENNGT